MEASEPNHRFQCSECHMEFKNERKGKEHTLLVHSVFEKDADEESPKDKEATKDDSEICSEGSKTSASTSTDKSGKEQFQCYKCFKIFSSRMELYNHAKTHSHKFECSICGKAFPTRNLCKLHMNTHLKPETTGSSGVKLKYQCHICGKVCNQDVHLKRHLLVHSNKLRLKCDVCGKLFQYHHQYNKHREIHHPPVTEHEVVNESYSSDIVHDIFSQYVSDQDSSQLSQNSEEIIVSSENEKQLQELYNQTFNSQGSKEDVEQAIRTEIGVSEEIIDMETSKAVQELQKETFDFLNSKDDVKEKSNKEMGDNLAFDLLGFKEDISKTDIETFDFLGSKENVVEKPNTEIDDHPAEVIQEDTKVEFSGEQRTEDESLEESNKRSFDCITTSESDITDETLSKKTKLEEDIIKPKVFQCDICDRIYRSQFYLNEHKHMHVDAPKFNCDTCNASFPFGTDLKLHVCANLKDRKAVDSLEKSSSETSFISENEQHSILKADIPPESTRLFKCDECGKSFSLRIQFRHHICKQKQIQCKHCKDYFPSGSELREHLKTHLKTYECDQCSQSFPRLVALEFHKMKHQKKKTFNCKYCEKPFALRFQLNQHEKMHENHFACTKCDANFSSYTRLRQHNLEKHTEMYECELCDVSFPSEAILTKHKLLLHQSATYKCGHCKEVFFTEYRKDIHERKNHPTECEICHISLTSYWDFKKHNDEVHQTRSPQLKKTDMENKIQKEVKSLLPASIKKSTTASKSEGNSISNEIVEKFIHSFNKKTCKNNVKETDSTSLSAVDYEKEEDCRESLTMMTDKECDDLEPGGIQTKKDIATDDVKISENNNQVQPTKEFTEQLKVDQIDKTAKIKRNKTPTKVNEQLIKRFLVNAQKFIPKSKLSKSNNSCDASLLNNEDGKTLLNITSMAEKNNENTVISNIKEGIPISQKTKKKTLTFSANPESQDINIGQISFQDPLTSENLLVSNVNMNTPNVVLRNGKPYILLVPSKNVENSETASAKVQTMHALMLNSGVHKKSTSKRTSTNTSTAAVDDSSNDLKISANETDETLEENTVDSDGCTPMSTDITIESTESIYSDTEKSLLNSEISQNTSLLKPSSRNLLNPKSTKPITVIGKPMKKRTSLKGSNAKTNPILVPSENLQTPLKPKYTYQKQSQLTITKLNTSEEMKKVEVSSNTKILENIKSDKNSNTSSIIIDSVYSTRPSDINLLDVCDVPFIDFENEKHIVWLANFLDKCKSLKYPISSNLHRKISHVIKCLSYVLSEPKGILNMKEHFSVLFNTHRELSHVVTLNLESIYNNLPT